MIPAPTINTRFIACLNTALGFTLIELLVSLCIFAIIALIVIPGFEHIIENIHAKQDFKQIIIRLQYTRELAASTKKTITLCPSRNLQNCDNNWQHEFIIFEDTNQNGKHDSNEKIYQHFKALKSPITYQGFPESSFIQFTHNGQASCNGTFFVSRKTLTGYVTKKLILDQSGYYHEQKP